MRLGTTSAVILLCVAICPQGRADIYSFVDDAGITHYSNVPNDARYEVLITAAAEGTRAGEHIAAGQVVANAQRYDTLIESASTRTQVEAHLIKAVIAVESGYNARAISKAGARGLMQLMPATARRYGVRNVFDPGENVDAGARYLKDLLARFGGDMELALAAYNAGEQAVERHGRRIPPFKETQRYVPRVLQIYRVLRENALTSQRTSTVFYYLHLRAFPEAAIAPCLPATATTFPYGRATTYVPQPVA